MFYTNKYNYCDDTYTSPRIQVQRSINKWRRLRRDQETLELEQQQRARANEYLRYQMDFKIKEDERQLRIEMLKLRMNEDMRQLRISLLKNRVDQDHLHLMKEEERKKRCTLEKNMKSEKKSPIFTVPDFQTNRSYLNDDFHITPRIASKKSSLKNSHHNESKLSQKSSSIKDEYCPSNENMKNNSDMSVKSRKNQKHEKKIYVKSGLSLSTRNSHIIKETGRMINIENKAENVSAPQEIFRRCRNAVTVEDSSDDEDESLFWTKLFPNKGQWMEPV